MPDKGSSSECGVRDEARRDWVVCYVEEAQIGEANDFRHLGEVDAVDGVSDVVVVGVEAGEEPKSGNIVEDEGELVRTKEDAESGIAVEAVIENEPDVLVFALDGLQGDRGRRGCR